MAAQSKTRKTVRQLRGTDVHVFKEGRLFIKQSFLRPKRPCIVHIRGLQLRITTFSPSQTVSYSLVDSTLRSHSQTLRLVLHIPSIDNNITFYAEAMEDFRQWRDSIQDALHWSFHRFYELADHVGRGAFAVVRQAYHRITGELVAVKIIEKNRCTDTDFRYLQREVDIALILKHPNIAVVSDLFQSETMLYIVLEYVKGGTLQSFIDKNGPLDEAAARAAMTDILSAIKYIHSKGVVHRDLKPENILCTKTKLPMRTKLIDFGLGRRIPTDIAMAIVPSTPSSSAGDDDGLGPEGLMTTPVGTPHYVAPEVLSSLPYGKEVDLFSCGVILYWLLSAQLPFNDPDPNRLADSIKRVEFNFAHKVWDRVSPDAKDLIIGLMDRSPISRLSAAVALGHPWFSHERRDSNVEVMPPVPGDQILTPRWKADPGLGPSADSLPHHEDRDDNQKDANDLHWSLTSPISPAFDENAHDTFRHSVNKG